MSIGKSAGPDVRLYAFAVSRLVFLHSLDSNWCGEIVKGRFNGGHGAGIDVSRLEISLKPQTSFSSFFSSNL